MAHSEALNLTKLSDTSPPAVAGNYLSIQISPGNLGWGASVAELQWSNNYGSLDMPDGAWHSHSPAVKFSSSFPGRFGIIGGGRHVRLKVIVADGDADPVSEYHILPRIAAPEAGTINRKILGQSRPANTTAVSLYSPAAGVRAEIEGITVCNTTGTDATFRLFLDTDGSTYDQSTAMYYDVTVTANTTTVIEPKAPWVVDDPDGNLGIRVGTSSALTFTAWGTEK